MRIPAGSHIGRYRIDKLIGLGGMGEVYLAHDEQLERPVALKLLPDQLRRDIDFQRRLKLEARAASALNHPNILTVHEIGEAEGEHFIATEYVDGVTLRKRVGRMSLLDVVRTAEHVADALAAAESAGVLHRDIKPDNVMIRSDGYVKVLDFGLAHRSIGSNDRTLQEAVSGTVHYMSPEQLRGQKLDSRTDVWSLGVLICELATGRRPFEGESAFDVITSIIDNSVPAIDAPPELQVIVRKALQKDREARYSSMREMRSDLRALRRALELDDKDWSSLASASDAVAIESDSSPLPTLSARRRSNLPVVLTPIIGRDRDISMVKALLAREEVRLITLTGPGGTGKTRLALQIATDIAPLFRGGVFFVPLTSVTDPTQVLDAIAKSLGMREDAGGSLLSRLQRDLANEELLLVLDNFEQVVEAGPLLVELLEAAPELEMLVTSQAALRVRGEYEFPVSPLDLPEGDSSIESVANSPSVALFVQRAQAIEPKFELTESNASEIAAICERLDGLPLAIELAAARIRMMSPKQMLPRLDSRLKLLTGGSRDLPTRQQTMHAAISWGFNLLDAEEKMLLARASVFDGGATLEAIEAVCIVPTPLDIASSIESLVDRSFLRRDYEPDGSIRFVMLGTIREFGFERLAEEKEEAAVRRAHAEYFLRFAETGEENLQTDEQRVWLDRFESDHANLQAAMQWSITNDSTFALRFGGALWWFWYLRGYYSLGRRLLEQALNAGAQVEEQLRARCLVGSGALAFLQCDYDRATERLEDAAEISRTVKDRTTFAAAVQFLGSIARERGAYDRALEHHRVSLDYWRQSGDRSGIARSLNYIGFASWLSGDYDAPRGVCNEALAIFRELGDTEGNAWSLMNLAAAAQCQGQLEEAMTLAKEALASSREAGFKEGIAWALNILGVVSRRRGQHERANGFLRKSFDFHWDLGDRWRTSSVLEALAGLKADAEDFETAALLFGATRNLRQSIATPVPPAEQFDFDRDVDAVKKALGETRFEELTNRGAVTPIHEILARRS